MSIQELAYLNFAIFMAANIAFTAFVIALPSVMNNRLRRSLRLIDKERAGKEKRYIVHYKQWDRGDSLGPLIFIVMGSFFLAVPFIEAYMVSWNAVVPFDFVVFDLFEVIFTFAFPAFGILQFYEMTFDVLVVTDQGFEQWFIERRKVRFFRTMAWSDINKIWFNRGYTSWNAELVVVSTNYAKIVMLTDWRNMLSFLKDLSAHDPEVIIRADEYTRTRIDFNINDPKSKARKEAMDPGAGPTHDGH